MQELADYSEAIRYIVGYAVLALVVGYVVGRLHGIRIGRTRECRKWSDETIPAMMRLERERDLLWRSAVAKKQRMNRLLRETGRV